MKEAATAISRTRGLMLTPEYAAPEQWRGMTAEEQDARVDLYALGGLLFEMLTGTTCFRAANVEGWMRQHLDICLRPPSSLRPEVKGWQGLDALMLRLLAKDREQRPASAAGVVELLDNVRPAEVAPVRLTEVEQHKVTQVEQGKGEEKAPEGNEAGNSKRSLLRTAWRNCRVGVGLLCGRCSPQAWLWPFGPGSRRRLVLAGGIGHIHADSWNGFHKGWPDNGDKRWRSIYGQTLGC